MLGTRHKWDQDTCMHCGVIRQVEQLIWPLYISRYFDSRGNELGSKPLCSGKFVDKKTILK